MVVDMAPMAVVVAAVAVVRLLIMQEVVQHKDKDLLAVQAPGKTAPVAVVAALLLLVLQEPGLMRLASGEVVVMEPHLVSQARRLVMLVAVVAVAHQER